jgi:hypothetical protein
MRQQDVEMLPKYLADLAEMAPSRTASITTTVLSQCTTIQRVLFENVEEVVGIAASGFAYPAHEPLRSDTGHRILGSGAGNSSMTWTRSR